jgi:hypothetical protein
MKLLSIRLEAGSGALARFDVEITPELRMYNMVLRSTANGLFRSYPPNAHGKHVATFHPALAEQITQVAVAAYESEREALGTIAA